MNDNKLIYIVWSIFYDGDHHEQRFCGAFSDPRDAEELKVHIADNALFHRDQLSPKVDEENDTYINNKEHWDYYMKYKKWFEFKECFVQEFVLDQPFNFEKIRPLLYSN